MKNKAAAVITIMLIALAVNLAFAEEWTLPITVTGEEGGAPNTFTVTIGGGDAQNFLPAPPAPPQYMTWVELYEPDWTGGPYAEMIYVWPPPADSAVWLILVDPNGNMMPPVSRTSIAVWDPVSLPSSGDLSIEEYYSGAIVIADMRTQDSLVVTGTETQYFNIIWEYISVSISIAVSEDTLDFGFVPVGNQAEQPLTIYSTGETTLVLYDIFTSEDAFYTDFDPSDSLIEAGDSLVLEVTFDPNIERIYEETLFIASNAGNADTVTVSLQGDGGAVPDTVRNLVVTIEGSDAILTWDEVNTSVTGYPLTVDCYLIYYEENLGETFNFLAYTPDTTYTHFGAAQFSTSMFYFVEAYIGEIEILEGILSQGNSINREGMKIRLHQPIKL
ncbi:MAG: hypothetical protein HQ591_11425 [candidate division Zixibacteria bacterium]|nr:hypothetical protein [Candidatus Tariuqbacter arcticus]